MSQSSNSFRINNEQTNTLSKDKKLFEQFVILGLPSGEPTLFDKNTNKLQIIVKDVYPKNTQNRGYLNNLHMWCFSQNKHIHDENGQLIDMASVQSKNNSMRNNNGKLNNYDFEKTRLQNFVITDEEGQKRYCTSLQIYELRKAKLRETDPVRLYYVPKSYVILSNFNYFEVHRQLFSYLLKVVIHPKIQGNYQNSVIFTDRQINTFEKYAHNYGFKEAQKMPLCQASQDTRDNSNLEQQSALQVKEEYILSFILSQLETFPLRTRYLSKSQLILKLDSQDIFSYKLNNSSALQSEFLKLDNFSYKPLLNKLSIPSIVEFLKAILLEKQIIIFSKDLSDVAHLCEAIFSLIKPLQWKCVYIPSLPNNMLDTLDIIVPYIIGVQRNMKDQILREISSENKLFLDLDTDFIIQDGIEMPAELKNNFQEQLKAQMKVYKELYKGKSDQSSKSSSARQEQSEGFVKLILNVKKVFLHFMISLLNNYTMFFLFPDDFDSNHNANKEIFDFKAYIRFMGSSFSTFYVDFASKTMIFRGLIEDSYKIVRQMAVFGKDISEAGQIEGADYVLIQFMLEIKKAAGLMKLKDQTNLGVCNVNLYRQREILSAFHIDHNTIITNYLQELSKPQIIETKGELLKYLIFLKKSSHQPFIDSHAIPKQSITLETIETAPIINLEEIQNQADIAISAKSENSKQFFPVDLKGGPRISQQISFKMGQQQIKKESSPSSFYKETTIHFPQAHRNILESAKDLLNMRSSLGESFENNPMPTTKQIISRETRTISLTNNPSNSSSISNNSQIFGKTFYTSTQTTSPYLMTRESMPQITTPTAAITEYYSEDKRKRKIFEQIRIKPRESGYGLINTTKNEISYDDEEFRRTNGSGWKGQIIEGLRGEDQDDLPNRSDIPEENNTVETVPDFFRGDLEMKNIIGLNIDQITSYHSYRVLPTTVKKPSSQFSNSNLSIRSGEQQKLQDVKNQYLSTESCPQRTRDLLEENKLNISLKTPFSVAGQVESNQSQSQSSEMNNTSEKFFKIMKKDDSIQSNTQYLPDKIGYLSKAQPTLNKDHQLFQHGMGKFNQDKQQNTEITQQSQRTWALKKCDYFQTENVQEEEETECIITDHDDTPKTTPSGGLAVISAPNVAFRTKIEKQNCHIKDDPGYLKEYFSYQNISQLKQQQQPLSSRNMNQISSNLSVNQSSQTFQVGNGQFNENKKEVEDKITKCNRNSSHNNLIQIQQQISNQNYNLSSRNQPSMKLVANQSFTAENLRINNKIITNKNNNSNIITNENISIHQLELPSQSVTQLNSNNRQNNNNNNKSSNPFEVYSKLISKPTNICSRNPLKESTSFNIISHKHNNSKDLSNNIKMPSKQIVNTTQNPYMENITQKRSSDRECIPTQLKPSRSSLDSQVIRQNYVQTENIQDKQQYLPINIINALKGPFFFKQKGNQYQQAAGAVLNNENNEIIPKKFIF